jgi:hypothetical protein
MGKLKNLGSKLREMMGGKMSDEEKTGAATTEPSPAEQPASPLAEPLAENTAPSLQALVGKRVEIIESHEPLVTVPGVLTAVHEGDHLVEVKLNKKGDPRHGQVVCISVESIVVPETK